jgi:N-acyl amino acid synthase of PEP-CTERM/exosortase system
LERDAFDRHSLHVGAVNGRGLLVGTARVVDLDVSTLPLFGRCTMFSDERALHRAGNKIVEISRVAVSRTYNQRQGDEHYGLQGSNAPSDRGHSGVTKRRGRRGEVVLCLFKACYQASKRIGATHWIVAIEKPLQCLLAQYGFTLRLIGPERDYFGQVAPYLMDLVEFETVILSNRIPALDDYLAGLEPEFSPQQYATS